MAIHPLWLALVALLPAGATWWTGQRVLRRIDDPALPDLLMRRRGQMGVLWGLALVGIVAIDGRQAGWAIPLMMAATLAASFPAQRVLLDERWGMGAYLWHSTRRIAGGLAFWMALVAAPMIVMGTRDSRLAAPLAAGLAAALLLWQHHYRRFWLWTHAATPLGARPALDDRFAAVMARATTPPPLLFRFGQPGERRAAAFAFPSASETGAVIFSDALLELLTPEETAAVFAHEVAHLEHYTPRRLRRMRVVTALLVVGLLALAVVLQRVSPGFHLLYTLSGAGAVLLALGVRASRSRGHETASDLRGAELCGDAEALVRALTKLHAALRLPRRWSADVERTATHPSLVHRIAALRAAAAAMAAPGAPATAPQPALAAPVLLPSTRSGGYVVMDGARIHIFDGVPGDVVPNGDASDVATLTARAGDARAIAYERLTRLALEEDGGRRVARLVVVERGGGRWSVPLAPDDMDRARSAIEAVDVRVGTAELPRPAEGNRVVPALAVCTAALALFVASQLGVLVLVAGAALFLPGAAMLGAFGTAAAARAAIALATGGADDASSRALLLLAALCAVVALGLAVRGARTARSTGSGVAEGAPALRTALVALRVLVALYAAAALWVAVATTPAKAVPLLHTFAALAAGLAAATALRPELGRRRWLAAAAGAAAIAGALATPLLDGSTEARGVTWRDTTARVVSSAPVAGMARDLVVAPGGARYVVRVFQAYAEEDEEDGEYMDEQPERPRLVLGALNEGGVVSPRAIGGHAAAFVGDDSLLLLASRGGADSAGLPGLELRLSALAPGEGLPALNTPSWRLALPALLTPELRVVIGVSGARRWSVTGRMPGAPSAVTTLEGWIGDTTLVRHDWPAPRGGSARDPNVGYAAVTPLGDGRALAARLRGDYRATLALTLVGVSPWTTELSMLRAAGAPRRLAELSGFARCVAGGDGRGPVAACALMDARGESRLVVVDSAGRVETVASLAGPVTALAVSRDGPVALASAGRRELMLLDPARRAGVRVALPDDLLTATGVAWTASGDVVVAGMGREGTRVVRVEAAHGRR